MQVVRSLANIHFPASACAIGMFDGVHIGHRVVLENAIRQARILNIPAVVASFASHPQFLLSKSPTPQLSTLEERLAEFERMGFDAALILDFDEWLKNLSPHAFVESILRDHLNVSSVTVGYDHRFGKNRAGDGDLLKQLGGRYGFDVTIIEPVKITDLSLPGQIVSSTLIRKLLSYGDVGAANTLLGRPYSLTGIVEQGYRRGSAIGFPTANLAVGDSHRIVPAVGTYAGLAVLNGREWPTVCNIGFSPTFGDAEPGKRVEVHLPDYGGPDFYNQSVTMRFMDRLRDERAFTSVESLVQQIQADCETLRAHQNEYLSRTTSLVT